MLKMIDKLDFIKINKFCALTDSIEKVKRKGDNSFT